MKIFFKKFSGISEKLTFHRCVRLDYRQEYEEMPQNIFIERKRKAKIKIN